MGINKKYIILGLVALTHLACSHLRRGIGGGSQQLSLDGGVAQINLPVQKYTLDNGLRVLVYENRQLPIFTYYTFFDVGGRHEEKGTTGATHFLEHMMFKGTERYGPGQFDNAVEGSGGHLNAYTSFDETVYYEALPSSMLAQIVDMEADRMQHLLLDPAAFESERQVVLEERKMRYENRDQGRLFLKMMQSVFTRTPYGGSVIGEIEDLMALSPQILNDFFKKFYTPDNAIIVVAGDVKSKEVIRLVRQKYGHLKSSSTVIKSYKAKKNAPENYRHRARFNGRHIKLSGKAPTPIFVMAYPGMAVGTPQSYVMDVLSSMLGDGNSSYLAQRFVRGARPRLASVYAANYTLTYNGVFYVGGKLLPGVNLESILRRIRQDLRQACGKNLNQRALQKTKNQYLVGYFGSIQTNSGVAHLVGKSERHFDDFSYYKKELAIYNTMELEQVQSTCRDLFSRPPITLSIWNKHPGPKKRR